MCKNLLFKKDDRPMKSCVQVGSGLPETPRGVLWARTAGSILVFSNSVFGSWRYWDTFCPFVNGCHTLKLVLSVNLNMVIVGFTCYLFRNITHRHSRARAHAHTHTHTHTHTRE